MIRALLALLLLCLPAAAAGAQPAQPAPEQRIERFGFYVVVADLGRARAFYEALFGKPPYLVTPSLIGFDIEGGLFALASMQAFRPNVRRGDNAVPYLRVRDIDREFARVRALAPPTIDAAVATEGPIRLFRFTDPDGNLIEYFALAARPGS